MNIRLAIGLLLFLSVTLAYGQLAPPEPFGAVPTERQLAWQEMEMYAMIEFSPITYLDDVGWGWGNESPSLLNPVDFNAETVVKLAKEVGFKGFLVQAKHHGGFCMWPTKTTPYNISASPWRGGKGDWIGEWAAACRKQGLKVGVYCCPWDRSTDKFGTPAYDEMYQQQLSELMTNYGEMFIVWFDGAPGAGGDGYYGGKDGYRSCRYPWDEIFALVRKQQPNAVIFSDAGPDVRWVGNESGTADESRWTTIDLVGVNGHAPAPGYVSHNLLNVGTRFGKQWIPAESDVPMRRSFTYHASDSNAVKSSRQLFDIYIHSVGRGGCMDLGLQINRKGTLDKTDQESLRGFGELLRQTFALDLAQGAKLTASNVRGGDAARFGPKHLLDGDRYSYWATDDAVTNPDCVVELAKESTFNFIRLRENIKLGQRLDSVVIDTWTDGKWKELAKVTSIGACRIIHLQDYVTASKLRLRLNGQVCTALSEFSLFAEPQSMEVPAIHRNKDGSVTLTTQRLAHQIRYTTDGSAPSPESSLYQKPFLFEGQGVIRAAVFNTAGQRGDVGSREFDVSKKLWRILGNSSEAKLGLAAQSIDDNDTTLWETAKPDKNQALLPQWIAIDLGQTEGIAAFTYLPRKDRSTGVVDRYEYHISQDGETWTKVAEGEFGNIRNSPVLNVVTLQKPIACRYFKFIATHVLEGNIITAAELGARRK